MEKRNLLSYLLVALSFDRFSVFTLTAWTRQLVHEYMRYVVGSKSFRPDIQKPRQLENAIYGEVNVSVEKCVEIKGDYVEK